MILPMMSALVFSYLYESVDISDGRNKVRNERAKFVVQLDGLRSIAFMFNIKSNKHYMHST